MRDIDRDNLQNQNRTQLNSTVCPKQWGYVQNRASDQGNLFQGLVSLHQICITWHVAPAKPRLGHTPTTLGITSRAMKLRRQVDVGGSHLCRA